MITLRKRNTFLETPRFKIKQDVYREVDAKLRLQMRRSIFDKTGREMWPQLHQGVCIRLTVHITHQSYDNLKKI